MLFKIAVDTIQREVKKALDLKTIPTQASTANIKNILAEKGLDEPYDRNQCLEIAKGIVDSVLKIEFAIALQNVSDIDSELGSNDGSNDGSNEVETVQNLDTPTNNQPDLVESTEMTYTPKDDFERAAIVKQTASDMSLALKPIECMSVAEVVGDDHDTEKGFLLAVIDHLKVLIQQQTLNNENLIDSGIVDIENIRYESGQRSMQKIADMSNRLKAYDSLLMSQLEKLTGITREQL